MTEVTLTVLPAAPLHALEIWRNAAEVARRFAGAGLDLPRLGRSNWGQLGGSAGLCLIRYEPTVWLVEGDIAPLPALLETDGALTAIGGGVVRVRLSGTGWRALLMEGGVFDAESADFAVGCSAATLIDHVAVRLHVVHADACIAYVPASFSAGLLHFWQDALGCLALASGR